MEKTNIRINNFYIIRDKVKYYQTDIDVLDVWRDTGLKELKNYTDKDVSEFLQRLMEKYDLYESVNFIEAEDATIKKITLKKGGKDIKGGG